MKPRTYSSEGIVLARRNYGEADRILAIYSKDYGRVTLLAKSIRKPASRKRGHLEVFNHIKFSVALGRGIDIITEAEMIETFSEIRKSLKKVALAYYFMEVIGKITHHEEKNLELFKLVLKYLSLLKVSSKLKDLRHKFIYDILVVLGYWPEGKKLVSPDEVLEEVIERGLSSVRVGKKLLI